MRDAVKWCVAGLVTLASFLVVTWLFEDYVTTLWIKHDDGARSAWGLGAGTAVSALAALWGKSYATSRSKSRPEVPGHREDDEISADIAQVVEDSAVGGGITQVSGAGKVRISHRAPVVPPSPGPSTPRGESASVVNESTSRSGQHVSRTHVQGPVDQVHGIDCDVEIEQ